MPSRDAALLAALEQLVDGGGPLPWANGSDRTAAAASLALVRPCLPPSDAPAQPGSCRRALSARDDFASPVGAPHARASTHLLRLFCLSFRVWSASPQRVVQVATGPVRAAAARAFIAELGDAGARPRRPARSAIGAREPLTSTLLRTLRRPKLKVPNIAPRDPQRGASRSTAAMPAPTTTTRRERGAPPAAPQGARRLTTKAAARPPAAAGRAGGCRATTAPPPPRPLPPPAAAGGTAGGRPPPPPGEGRRRAARAGVRAPPHQRATKTLTPASGGCPSVGPGAGRRRRATARARRAPSPSAARRGARAASCLWTESLEEAAAAAADRGRGQPRPCPWRPWRTAARRSTRGSGPSPSARARRAPSSRGAAATRDVAPTPRRRRRRAAAPPPPPPRESSRGVRRRGPCSIRTGTAPSGPRTGPRRSPRRGAGSPAVLQRRRWRGCPRRRPRRSAARPPASRHGPGAPPPHRAAFDDRTMRRRIGVRRSWKHHARTSRPAPPSPWFLRARAGGVRHGDGARAPRRDRPGPALPPGPRGGANSEAEPVG